jgi:hypothetical protein
MSDNDLVKSVDDIKEILGVVTDKVPGILRGLRDVLYSKEAAENMGEAVATFYSKLVSAGIPKEEAMAMTKGYVINLRDIFGGKNGFNVNLSRSDDEEDDE